MTLSHIQRISVHGFLGSVTYLLAQLSPPSDSSLGQTLVIITTLIGAIGGVITAIGGILISMERIKSENERMRLARDDQVRGLREEMHLLHLQVAQTTEGRRFIERIEKSKDTRANIQISSDTDLPPGGDHPDPLDDPTGQILGPKG